ncbi:uncharacterized protein SPSK_01953 [Sporothrix schenckii 1099-18]|uniref:Uncharacterized protein n=1 Tax=Sporothrix schenckii 1099-18 TaxID=1397361 RepID=A0A0F2MD35_SPOSC|nr:uncharacterized protein SPSK_01953 [Sporothrix schenckii 1099-18]KJR87557.1 hypothetical protein SPSK_01953 [Sporothrix schenckii 1099-18]
MNTESSSGVPFDIIQDRFHHQVGQHGHELLSFVAEKLRNASPGISITLGRLEMPASQVNWLWCVGSADQATEQAVLHFFQTDAGKRALVSDGPDTVEFKLASVLLRLPPSHAEDPVLPEDLAAAAGPLRDGQEAIIYSKAPPHPICIPARTSGWLQVSPHVQFSRVSVLQLQEQAHIENLGSWLVSTDASTVYGNVAAISGSRSILVTPLAPE